MKEQCISFETSKLAKEKGFPDYECTRYYLLDGNIVSANWVDIYEPKEYYPIVSQSLLQQWLREEHNLHISISSPYFRAVETEWMASIFLINQYRAVNNVVDDYNTYESVLEQALLQALNLIK